MRLITFLICFSLIVVTFCQTTYATEASLSASYSAQIQPTGNDIGISKILPDSPFYFLKTVREILEMKFAPTERVQKIRQLEFATRRLREVKGLVSTTHQDLIQPTLERYWAHIAELPEKILFDKELGTKVSESLTVHLEVLENTYPKLSERSAKMAIRAIVGRLIKRSNLLNNARFSACHFLSKEATSSSLNEVEKVIVLERADQCFQQVKMISI